MLGKGGQDAYALLEVRLHEHITCSLYAPSLKAMWLSSTALECCWLMLAAPLRPHGNGRLQDMMGGDRSIMARNRGSFELLSSKHAAEASQGRTAQICKPYPTSRVTVPRRAMNTTLPTAYTSVAL